MSSSLEKYSRSETERAPPSDAHAHGHPPNGGSLYATGIERAMSAMMDAMHAAKASGDPDRDFLSMMIPHHEGAIEMARLILLYGRDPLTRQLATEIIAGQHAEVISMLARLEALSSEAADYPALTGTRGPE